jgi:methanogenic corrinoid protein MtbC1
MPKEFFDRLIDALVNGDDIEAPKLAEEMVRKGVSAIDISSKGCGPGMMKAGEKFASGFGGSSLTDLLLSGEAMKAVLEVIRPKLGTAEAGTKGKFLLGQIEGDIHSIGKNVVKTMLESAGWKVIDVGEDVPAEMFIKKAKDSKPGIIGVGSAMTGSLTKLVELKKKIGGEKLPVRLMIGGWSTSPELAKSIGAYYAKDAVETVKIAGEKNEFRLRTQSRKSQGSVTSPSPKNK